MPREAVDEGALWMEKKSSGIVRLAVCIGPPKRPTKGGQVARNSFSVGGMRSGPLYNRK